MDKLSAINLTFDKLLITVLAPGLVAIFPYILIFFGFNDNLLVHFEGQTSLLVALISILSLMSGLIIENLGSVIEKHVYDKINAPTDDIWNSFLKLTYEREPVGHRYLRNILMRMKFELGLGVGLIFMSIGLMIYNYHFSFVASQGNALLFLFVMPALLSIYLLREGLSSSTVLHKTRMLLVEEFGNNEVEE